MTIEDIEKLEQLIEEIENTYNVEPNEENEGDCLNAKEGFEILIDMVKKK